MNIRYRIRDYLNLPTHTALGMSMSNWLHLLLKNRFAIHVLYIPKVIFITVTVALNIPLQWIEHLLFHKKIKQTNVTAPVFILGHPRSGTTFLHYVLSKDPSFAFCTTTEGLLPSIFLTAGKLFEKLLKMAMPKTRPQDNVKSGATLPIEEEFAMASISSTSWVHGLYFPKNINTILNDCVLFNGEPNLKHHWKNRLHYFLRKLSYAHPRKKLLLKSPANTGRLKELYELYPDAKFIHIHRNPFDVFVSTERLFEKIIPVIGFQKPDNEFMREHVLYAYETMYSKYLADRVLIPANQLYEFSYEEFITSPIAVVKSAYEYLNLGNFNTALPFFEEELNNTKDYQPNTYSEIDGELRDTIAKRWAFAFAAFGYS